MSDRNPSIEDHIPVVFALHFLAGSAREWAPVASLLEGKVRLIALDLPGFGDASATPGYSVAEMTEYIARAIRAEARERWYIVGHSMGAKVAAAIARRAEDGGDGLSGLAGVLTIAGSPPGPEPMDEKQRLEMMGWFAGDVASNRREAQEYISSNSSDDLDSDSTERAVADVLRANRAAWIAWLESGSREDWSDRIGVLKTPALVIAGSDDENLGPEAQARLMAPHYANVRTVTISGARHLLPMERPSDIARSILELVDTSLCVSEGSQATDEAYRDLIASSRVGKKTREALVARGAPDDAAYEPAAVSSEAFAVLRAVVNRVIPQTESTTIDIAARIDRQLQSAVGDGWRFAALPPDAEAYNAGLSTLNEEARKAHGSVFADLDDAVQDELLTAVADGRLGSRSDARALPQQLTAAQMRSWFEDLRADAVKTYVSHPATLARIGYSGIANGGDGEPKSGFARVGIDDREPWEPSAPPSSPS